MIKCKYCHEYLYDDESDDENIICPRCGMPIDYDGDDEDPTEDSEEIDAFFSDEDDDNLDPDALTQADLDELLNGFDDEDEFDPDDLEFDDPDEDEEDY